MNLQWFHNPKAQGYYESWDLKDIDDRGGIRGCRNNPGRLLAYIVVRPDGMTCHVLGRDMRYSGKQLDVVGRTLDEMKALLVAEVRL